jgi:hypothetical protein
MSLPKLPPLPKLGTGTVQNTPSTPPQYSSPVVDRALATSQSTPSVSDGLPSLPVGLFQAVMRTGGATAGALMGLPRQVVQTFKGEAAPIGTLSTGEFQKPIYGTDKPIGFGTEGAIFGLKEGSPGAVGVGATFSVLDLATGGGAKGLKGLVELLVAEKDATKAAQIMKAAGFADDIAQSYGEVFAKTKNAKLIEEGLLSAQKLHNSTKIVDDLMKARAAAPGKAVVPAVKIEAAVAKGEKVGFKEGYNQAKTSITNQLQNTFGTKIDDLKRGFELKRLKTDIVTRDATRVVAERTKAIAMETARVKDEIVKYVKTYIPKELRGNFLVAVRDSKSQKDLIRVFTRVDSVAQKAVLKESINTLKDTIGKLSTSDAVAVDYRNRIKDIVDQYELTGHSKGIIERLKATQAALDKAREAGGNIDLPQRVKDKLQILSRTPREDLTLSQVEALQHEIELLGRLGRTKWATKEALYEAEKSARTTELMQTAAPINSVQLAKLPIGEQASWFIKQVTGARNYSQKLGIGLQPIDGFAEITGMQPMKKALDLNFSNYLVRNADIEAEWIDLTADMTAKNYERIGAYAAAKQEGGLHRLANAGITEEEINALKLTKEEEAVYEYARKTFDDMYPDVRKYTQDVYNADVGQVENYVSFMSNSELMNELEMYDRFGVNAEDAFRKRTKTVEQGFAKERAKESTIKLELNIDKIFRRHIDDVAYMLEMGRDIKQYFEIVNSPTMRTKLGDMGSLAWLEYLDLMARKGGTEGAKRIAALDILRKNAGAGVLGFRLSSALVQFTSFTDSVGTIGAEWATKGASNIATSKEWRSFIMDNFPEVKKAVGDDIAFREFGETFLGRMSQTSMAPLQYMDGLMRSSAAAGAYEKLAKAKGIAIDLANPDKELIQEAMRLTRNSQGSSFFKDQPLAPTTGFGLTGNRSLNKTLLMFQSFMLNRWDNLSRQIWRMGIKEGNYKKAAASTFWMVIVAAAMEEGIRRGVRGLTNMVTGDNQKEKPFVSNAATNILQNVPIAGSLLSSITYSSNPVPIINTFEDLLSGIGSAYGAQHIETKLKGAVKAAGAIGSLSGVPGSSQAEQLIRKSIPQPKSESSAGGGMPKLPSLPKLPSMKPGSHSSSGGIFGVTVAHAAEVPEQDMPQAGVNLLKRKSSNATIDTRTEFAKEAGAPDTMAQAVAIASSHTGMSVKNLMGLFLSENGGKWDPKLVGVDPTDIGVTQLNKAKAIPEITKPRPQEDGKSYFEANFGHEFDVKNPNDQIVGSAVYLNWLKMALAEKKVLGDRVITNPSTFDLFMSYKLGAKEYATLPKNEKKWPKEAKERKAALSRYGITP